MKNICVFCGSSHGTNALYTMEAKKLGAQLVKSRYNLVYGGGSVGLMGEIADAVMNTGGKVIGVIPEFLVEKEVDHKGITKMHRVKSMHERKKKMADLSDAFIAMPGGFGTFEELFEILTWAQLGLVHKPIGLFNVNGYYDSLIQMFEKMVVEGFLKKENMDLLVVEMDAEKLLTNLRNYKKSRTTKWLDKDQT